MGWRKCLSWLSDLERFLQSSHNGENLTTWLMYRWRSRSYIFFSISKKNLTHQKRKLLRLLYYVGAASKDWLVMVVLTLRKSDLAVYSPAATPRCLMKDQGLNHRSVLELGSHARACVTSSIRPRCDRPSGLARQKRWRFCCPEHRRAARPPEARRQPVKEALI